MAGHSHWAGIKHKKAAVDNKRGKLWSKLSKAIIIAAKMGGGDPVTNIRLRQAIQDAKDVSMPKDNITRAIKKGTGELDGGNVEEIIYEGYGAHGVAIMCDIMTDNRNRTAPELKKMFEIHGGNMGATNCVAWLFERKGLFLIPVESADEETVMETSLEAGADDIQVQGDQYEITCEPELYSDVADALTAAEITVSSKQVTRIPNNTVELDAEQARKVLKLMEALDDHDDVQNVSANFDLSEDVLAELQADA
ncbi:MAG: YebC/PmpR family DNA-binding transcriptional regulator [Planctomycetaceae bacterium]|nr:YebC/PmpR family DNA-binding transcriptional regulator [Planctomycetaceae bacterium]|tara:strand:- start:10726 stop:11481 length:756 start_codon:yes stop_codon:yes gene_type:complete